VVRIRGRIVRLLAATTVFALVAVACSSNETDTGQSADSASPTPAGEPIGTLRVFAFEDSLIPEVMEPFQALYPDVEVQGAAFDSGDEALTKLESGFQTDVVEVCTREVPRYTDAGVLMPLDTSRLTDWDSVYPVFKEGGALNGEQYVAVAQGGPAGVVWNPDLFPAGVTSYKQLFEDPALKGKVAMDGTPYYMIAIGALALGYEDPYQLSEADLDRVTQYFIDHKDQFRSFYGGDADSVALPEQGDRRGRCRFPTAGPTRQGRIPIGFNFAEGTLTWMCRMGIRRCGERGRSVRLVEPLVSRDQKYFAEKWKYLASTRRR
jgi:spermidine/putrescine-binding protein